MGDATQYLEPQEGDEKAALKSIHSLFGITRDILKFKGRKSVNFTRASIVVLNQVYVHLLQNGTIY